MFQKLSLSFIVLKKFSSCFSKHLTFKSVIQYELIFVWGKNFRLRFSFKIDIQFSNTIYSIQFLHWIAFVPCQKITWLYLCGSISWFSILLHSSIQLAVFIHKFHIHKFNLLQIENIREIQKYSKSKTCVCL